ncbi:MAG TPA: phosphotransferase, partial [Thermomicrobiales bacterium]|nr:phosphotransferase [Thermomicrobiales bacterium]
MTIESPQVAEVRTILASHGLASEQLTTATGVVNNVWLTPELVVRLNGGRFPDAFGHEARILDLLPATIPHPEAIAHGSRVEGGEYLVVTRVPGVTLDEAWPDLDPDGRQRVIHELAAIVQTLHALPVAAGMRNPWIDDALTIPIPADAYHASPLFLPVLLASARNVRPDLATTVDQVKRLTDDRLDAFGDEPDVLVHADIHVRNILVDGEHISGLIDWEGSRPGIADNELDTLIRFLGASRQVGSEQTNDYSGLIHWFREGYPELFAHPRLVDRLEVYEAMWHLVQIHHWRPEYVTMVDPAAAFDDLLAGAFRAR